MGGLFCARGVMCGWCGRGMRGEWGEGLLDDGMGDGEVDEFEEFLVS